MKKILYLLFILINPFIHAQTFDLGVKAGLLLDSNSNIILQNTTTTTQDNANNKLNFHAGIYGLVGFAGYFIQPELYYAQIGKNFEINGNSTTIVNRRIDFPLLVGKKITMIRLYAGPVFSAYLKDNITANNLSSVKSDDFTIGFQAGVGLNVKKLKFDIRLDQAISERTLQFTSQSNNYKMYDNRPRLILLSVGYDLF